MNISSHVSMSVLLPLHKLIR